MSSMSKEAQRCRHYGECPVCKKTGQLTRHHILPRRFFRGSKKHVFVCRVCHDEIEKEIPKYEEMPIVFYGLVLDKFGL